jgi:hypothetical protein
MAWFGYPILGRNMSPAHSNRIDSDAGRPGHGSRTWQFRFASDLIQCEVEEQVVPIGDDLTPFADPGDTDIFERLLRYRREAIGHGQPIVVAVSGSDSSSIALMRFFARALTRSRNARVSRGVAMVT